MMALELAAPADDDEVEASPSLGRPEDVMGVSGERRGGMKGRARGMGSYSPSFSIGLASICHTERGGEGGYVRQSWKFRAHSKYSNPPSLPFQLFDLSILSCGDHGPLFLLDTDLLAYDLRLPRHGRRDCSLYLDERDESLRAWLLKVYRGW